MTELNGRQAIVHIGYHKTATTWFQNQLYPRVTSHRYIARDRVKEGLLNPHAFAFDPEAARAHLELSHPVPPILCDENMSGSFRTGGLMGAMSKEVAERIHQVLPQAQIVVFIRNQVEMAAAAYAQYLKKGGTFGPRRFLFPARYRKGARRQPFKRPLFSFDHFTYLGLIRHYRHLFGTDHVHVFTYEAFRQDLSSFLTHFTAELGLTVDLDAPEFALANATYRHRTLALARLLNHFTAKWDADKRHLLPILPSKTFDPILRGFNRTPLAGRRLAPEELLGSDIVAFINAFYAETNRALAAETGLPLADYGYPGTWVKAASVTPDSTVAKGSTLASSARGLGQG